MGSPPPSKAVLGDFPQQLIKRKARQLSHQHGFARHEEDDLRHELVIRVLRVLPKFDPSRGGFEEFFTVAIETATGMMARERKRLKRGGATRTQSLDMGARESGGMSVALSEADARRRSGTDRADDIDLVRFEVAAVRSSLPPHLGQVADLLALGTEAAAARTLGVSRRQIRKAKAELQRLFRAAGLDPGGD